MSPASRAATTEAPTQRDRGTGPLHTDSRGVPSDRAAFPVPRPRPAAGTGDHGLFAQAVARTPRGSRTDLRATHGSEDACGASPEAQWQGRAGMPGFPWQDPGPDRAITPGRGLEASWPRIRGPA